MIQEQLAHLPEFLPDYRPFPPVKEHTAWQGLPLRAKQRFLQAGEAALQTPIAPLPLSLWLDFTHTGRRTPWETAYFSRRARLCALVSAECVEHKGRFLDEIADTVWAICEESAWQLPAHNSYVRDTPQLPLPDTTRPIVDLFAAETGALLALTRYLLPDELDTAASGITARMERELNARILTPYFTSHFWWMGNGEEPMCNWTSWCTQNVLLTVFLLPTTQQQRKAAVKQAAYSLDCFLKDYGADGCCNEGAQYYRHAGLTLWGCLEILSNVAPEAFRPLFRETKIKNIAEYICNVHVEGPYYLNFGDCSPLAGRCGAREYRFGQAVGSDALQALAAADFRADADPDHLQNPDGSTHINLWYRLTTAFAEQELMEYAAVPQHRSAVWYPSVGIYAARQGSWVLGAKFGSNGDSHNHNDTGSITVYKDGRPFLIDIGVESYTKKTFSPQRYEIWTMQSAWHNLPTFVGGEAAHAQAQVAGDRQQVQHRGEALALQFAIRRIGAGLGDLVAGLLAPLEATGALAFDAAAEAFGGDAFGVPLVVAVAHVVVAAQVDEGVEAEFVAQRGASRQPLAGRDLQGHFAARQRDLHRGLAKAGGQLVREGGHARAPSTRGVPENGFCSIRRIFFCSCRMP